MLIHAAVSHALTLPHRVNIHYKPTQKTNRVWDAERLRLILFKGACHRYTQISSHKLYIKKWARTHTQTHTLHTQSQIRSECASSEALGNAALRHINTHKCSHTHTGLALFWHAALRWAVWGFRGIGRCWLCHEPAEPLHSHSCLPHHLRRASNHCGKSGQGRAEDISLRPSSSSIPLRPFLHLPL